MSGSEQPDDFMPIARIVMEYGLDPAEDSQPIVRVAVTTGDESGELPPMITTLGLMEMARGTVEAIYAGVEDE